MKWWKSGKDQVDLRKIGERIMRHSRSAMLNSYEYLHSSYFVFALTAKAAEVFKIFRIIKKFQFLQTINILKISTI